MFYKEFKPKETLRPFIKCFWALEHDYSQEPMKSGERIWPDGYYEMIFTIGEPYSQFWDGSSMPLSKNFLIGLFNTVLFLNSAGKTGLYGVRFHAWGLYPFLKTSMSTFNNRITDLSRIFDFDLTKVNTDPVIRENYIYEIQDLFLRNLPQTNPETDVVKKLGEMINSEKGNVKISDLIKHFNIPPRKIQKLYLDQTGISSKHYAKIIRFREAKTAIEKNPDINLAKLAYDCGYSDQPHFIRNFKQFFGITPREHIGRVKHLITFYNND